MRIEVGRLNPGSSTEVQFFLDRVDATGEFFYLRLSPRGGVLRLPLDDAEGQPFYENALEAVHTLESAS